MGDAEGRKDVVGAKIERGVVYSSNVLEDDKVSVLNHTYLHKSGILQSPS